MIKRHFKTKAILGDRSLAQYYADRLQCDIRTIEILLESQPLLLKRKLIVVRKKFRIIKFQSLEGIVIYELQVDEKIDYLLNDAGMETSDIVIYPNVLLMPTEKMKKRIAELQSYGCRCNILGIVCQSNETYKKFLIYLKEQRANEHEGRIK